LDTLFDLLESTIGVSQARGLALLLFFLPIFFLAHWTIKRGTRIALRPINAFAAMHGLLAQSAEAGQPVHLSLGTGGIADASTADTAAGLQVLEYLADRAAVNASPPIVSVANPTVLPVAQDILRRAYNRHGYPEDYDAKRIRFVAPDPNLNTGITPAVVSYAPHANDAFGYAAGVMQLINKQKLIANVMVGRFGDEFLLMSETAAQKNMTQIGGTSDPQVLPFVYTSVSHPLIGEEIYAGGAYLSHKPWHLSSLLAQDILRWLIAFFVLGGIAWRTLGL
jgi:hypothetical protein